ncbi:MAG: chemotaxis protein CheD [Clostridia bacterium]|nr:chemotaxis protein CheD [Clostridia bacterium]
MNNTITVNISDMKVAQNADTLVTYALGSCIGICFYDPFKKIGALGHIMLPFAHNAEDAKNKKHRFADTCIPEMINEMVKLGCNKRNIVAKIAGGATMFKLVNPRNPNSSNSDLNKIGAKNISAVKETLKEHRIVLLEEDTGADYARTLYFDTESGKVTIKSCNRQLNII